MPLAYPAGTLAEHRACRDGAVAFDVSHLGTVRVEGPGAFDLLQRSLTNDLRKIAPGRAQYTHLLDQPTRSVVDDIIVWWVADERLRRHAQRLQHRAGARRRRRDRHDRRAGRDRRAGTRGPSAAWRPSPAPAAAVPRLRGRPASPGAGVPCTVAGTGYTGEDGVECAVPATWRRRSGTAVLAAGIAPAGPRGARHPAPRGGPAPARARARPRHHPAAGRPGLGRRLGQGRLPGTRRPASAERDAGPRAPPARPRDRGPATAPRRGERPRGRRPGGHRSRAATSPRCSSVGIALALIDTASPVTVDGDGRPRRARQRGSRPRLAMMPFVAARRSAAE